MTELSFKIPEEYLSKYKRQQVPWGFGTLSELVFLRTYSRVKDDGGKERWWEVVRRVVEGMLDIQKKHSAMYNLRWDDTKALRTAMEAYDTLFNLLWSPAGRGLWAMGTDLVNDKWDSSALYNCFFVSTKDIREDFAAPSCFLMSASMHGGGVGFDTLGADTPIRKGQGAFGYKVPDTREGWVKSVELLLNYFAGGPKPVFDYTGIRSKGMPIKTFGGVAPGPEPLRLLHSRIDSILSNVDRVTSRHITDIMNVIGVAVVSGNVRRSAEIAFGSYEDKEFWNLKDYSKDGMAYRAEWGWMSNNTLQVYEDTEVDYEELAQRMAYEGEPGLMFMDNARNYGRMNNGPNYADMDVMGSNPCGEIPLENFEACNLVETYLPRISSVSQFQRVLKFAYLYAKTVTLLPTVWPETNAVQLKNRRIGVSVTGTAQFVDMHGYNTLGKWLDAGYSEVRGWDDIYSRWLGIRESIKVTTSKPSGTVSLLAGVSPGIHFPTSTQYIRRVTMSGDNPLVRPLRDAGYNVADSVYSAGSVVAEIPTRIEGVRSEDNVSVFEKIGLQVLVQQSWADNMISSTVVFDADNETQDLASALKMNEKALKSISALPRIASTYEQLPEERITPDEYNDLMDGVVAPDFSNVYNGVEEVDDAQRQLGCDGDSCVVV
jgi:adenosylcobalamin-dependent ribonucleoside-triphosphate reductase